MTTVIGKDDLIHQVAAKAGTNLKDTNEVINAFTEVVREDVAKGKEVRLVGFGTWNLRNVAARKVKSIHGVNRSLFWPASAWVSPLVQCSRRRRNPAREKQPAQLNQDHQQLRRRSDKSSAR